MEARVLGGQVLQAARGLLEDRGRRRQEDLPRAGGKRAASSAWRPADLSCVDRSREADGGRREGRLRYEQEGGRLRHRGACPVGLLLRVHRGAAPHSGGRGRQPGLLPASARRGLGRQGQGRGPRHRHGSLARPQVDGRGHLLHREQPRAHCHHAWLRPRAHRRPERTARWHQRWRGAAGGGGAHRAADRFWRPRASLPEVRGPEGQQAAGLCHHGRGVGSHGLLPRTGLAWLARLAEPGERAGDGRPVARRGRRTAEAAGDLRHAEEVHGRLQGCGGARG
mmetsp:Transcript_57559/g.129428  ORF Transcript_57559/g.129428 Transcript_57559/m.129428 type:complete len:281 (-) Transcript_57559:27-869(-)